MKQVVPWSPRDEHEGITAMNARHMWPQLHTNFIALVRRTQVCMERRDMLMDTREEKVETGLLKPLFEARLQYQSDMEAIVLAETREGELVGSGDGRVSGDLLSGNARWSMYAGNCAYVFVRAGLAAPPGQHLCTVHPAGVIETSDGAQIWFDARGYGLRGAEQGQPHLWRLTMAMQFTTADQRYQWMNTALGVVISEFDERAGRAHWRAFLP
jgi:Protein of unknown function (DUF3237)